MIYVIPTFNKPSGISWSNKVREEFVNVIKNTNILVIEDDPYNLISYDEKKYNKLYELDKTHIIYISSFSKYISPAFSVGYIICKKELLDKLYLIKKTDLCCNGFVQNVILDYLKNNNLKKLISKRLPLYKIFLKRCLKYLDKNDYKYDFFPTGGLFMIVKKDNQIKRFNICSLK